MKKSNPKKLTLSRETVRCLEADGVALVLGGVNTGLGEPSVFSTGEDCCRTR